MKLFNNLIKIIKKSTLLEKLVFILLIILILTVFHNIKYCKEGFAGKPSLIKKVDSEIFDDFYVDIYDTLLYNKIKNNFEVNNLLKNNKSNVKPYVLDIGCGTGHQVNLLSKNDVSVIGIDKSSAMIKRAKTHFPDLTFKVCDALDSMEFEKNTFTHITCLYFTIYYIKDKKQLFENCYKWLLPNGKLIVHLVDLKKFNHTIPIATSYDKKNRITKNNVNFDNMNYKTEFKLDDKSDINIVAPQSSNAQFKETFQFKNSNDVRINEHKLYMSTQKSILSLAKGVGFKLESQVEMDSIKYKNNFLYTLMA